MEHPQEFLAKDESHPIPEVDVCDIHGERKDGGHDLVVVIASPLRADERSLLRLKEKFAGYLRCIAHFRSQAAQGSSSIIVKIHPDSDPTVFDVLARYRHWVEEYDATLVIDRIA